MPSPLKTSDRKKHALSDSNKFEDSGSSDFRRKKLKREDGAEEWTGKRSELFGRVEPNLKSVRIERTTMDARNYKSLLKHQLRNVKTPGLSGDSTGSGSQFPPRPTDNMSEGGTRSRDMQKSFQDVLKLEILKLCQILQLSDDVRVVVGRFLEYLINKHEVSREPETKLEAFGLSLCWSAASLLKCKINKKESLLLAKQRLLFGCSVEEVSNMYSKLRKLRKMFLADVGNVKELYSSKQCTSTIEDTKKDLEQPQKSPIEEEMFFLRSIKRVERKLEKRMNKLIRKQEKEIDEFHRIWGEHNVLLLEQHRQRVALVSSRHKNSPEKLNELKRIDDELRKKMKEHKRQSEINLKDLKAQHLAKKTKEIEKKASWLKEMKSAPQVEPSCMMPSVETGSGYPSETATICLSPNCETEKVNSLAFGRPSIDKFGQLSNLLESVNASENNIVTKLLSSEGQLPNEPASNAKEVRESAGKELVGDLHGTSNDSEIKIIAKPSSSKEQLPNEPPSSAEEVMKSAGNEVQGGMRGSGNAYQNNYVINMPSDEVQLPFGAVPSEEAMRSADNELQKRPKSPTCAQMANTEAPAQEYDERLPIEVGESDQIVCELILKNPAEQQQQPPSADIPVDTNQPTSLSLSPSPLPSPSPGIDHVLIIANPSEQQQLPSSANILVEMNQPISASPFPSTSPVSDHGLILSNPSEHQRLPPSVNIPVNIYQPTSASTSVVERARHSEELSVSINAPAPQHSHYPPFPVGTNQHHPVPASVVEQEPCREGHIVTLNAEAPIQHENSHLPSNQPIFGPVFSPTSFTHVNNASPHTNQPDPCLAINDNHQLVEDTPVLPNQVNSQTHMGTAPPINSSVGDLSSYLMLRGPPLAAPQITVQRLTLNPLYNEYDRLCRESKSIVEIHENVKLQLKCECEKELAEIRKKYELKLHDAEATFLEKKKELDINSTKVLMNGLYAQAFENMAEYKTAFKLPQGVSSNLTQQVHLPNSQAQPRFSPSIAGSSASVLPACNRQNRPQLISTVTPPRLNLGDNSNQAPPPIVRHFRSPPPFFETRFASVPQRAPAHPERPHLPAYQPVHRGVAPLSAVRGGYPSLENQYQCQSAFVPNFQNQVGTHPSSSLPPVLAPGTNLGLFSQAMAASNGGNPRINMGHSGEMSGFICLSDDE